MIVNEFQIGVQIEFAGLGSRTTTTDSQGFTTKFPLNDLFATVFDQLLVLSVAFMIIQNIYKNGARGLRLERVLHEFGIPLPKVNNRHCRSEH